MVLRKAAGTWYPSGTSCVKIFVANLAFDDVTIAIMIPYAYDSPFRKQIVLIFFMKLIYPLYTHIYIYIHFGNFFGIYIYNDISEIIIMHYHIHSHWTKILVLDEAVNVSFIQIEALSTNKLISKCMYII